jgi:leader peptidase (prepilin peptidase)/N-methyltransferase
LELISVLQHEPALFYSAVIIFSLLVGSFLNVVIHRTPVILMRGAKKDCLEFLSEHHPECLSEQGKSPKPDNNKYNLIVPRSACPKCGHMITALENIPIISYLFLRGKCRQCGTPISIRYPIVEALSAVLVLIVAMKFGVSYATLFGAIFTWVLISLTFIDIDTQYLPDQLTLPMLWLGVLLALDGMYVDITASVIGAVAGYMVLWTVYQVFKLLTKKEGMGFGDFKLLAMIGAWCGWQVLPAVILISSVIGSIVGILLIITKYHEKGKPIPFGPYLAGAGWIVFMWGQQINNFYLNLFN